MYEENNSLSLKDLISMTIREDNNSPVVNELLKRFSSPRELSQATIHELVSINGLDCHRAGLLLASIELVSAFIVPMQRHL